MKADLASAYAASLARVASWAVIAGLVYRTDGTIAFAAFSYVRAIITAVSLTGLGLAPALTILLPQFRIKIVPAIASDQEKFIDYARPAQALQPYSQQLLMATAMRLLLLAIIVLLVFGVALRERLESIGSLSVFSRLIIASAPIALISALARIAGDVAGAKMQTDGRLILDNCLQVGGEISWVALSLLSIHGKQYENALQAAISALAMATIATAATRIFLVRQSIARGWIGLPYATLLVRTGSVLLLAQLSDLLYGPANQAMIKGYLSTEALATYAPLLHIDAALLLGVGGLATLLLPKTAIAIADRNPALARRYYVNGTLASLALLSAGAAVAWAFAPRLFMLWFKDPLPATAALLPLVMIHTVIGGSAGVGRSVLFGLNRAKAYTLAALIGGVANVSLAIVLVTHTSLGLRAIVLATIITVFIRCALWMPWYILKCLREEAALAPLPVREV